MSNSQTIKSRLRRRGTDSPEPPTTEAPTGLAALDVSATFGLPTRQVEEEAGARQEAESGYPDQYTKASPLGEDVFAARAEADQERLVGIAAAVTVQLETTAEDADAASDRHADDIETRARRVETSEEAVSHHDQQHQVAPRDRRWWRLPILSIAVLIVAYADSAVTHRFVKTFNESESVQWLITGGLVAAQMVLAYAIGRSIKEWTTSRESKVVRRTKVLAWCVSSVLVLLVLSVGLVLMRHQHFQQDEALRAALKDQARLGGTATSAPTATGSTSPISSTDIYVFGGIQGAFVLLGAFAAFTEHNPAARDRRQLVKELAQAEDDLAQSKAAHDAERSKADACRRAIASVRTDFAPKARELRNLNQAVLISRRRAMVEAIAGDGHDPRRIDRAAHVAELPFPELRVADLDDVDELLLFGDIDLTLAT